MLRSPITDLELSAGLARIGARPTAIGVGPSRQSRELRRGVEGYIAGFGVEWRRRSAPKPASTIASSTNAQVERAGTEDGVVTAKVIVRPPTALKFVLVLPVKLIEFAVKPETAKEPASRLPEVKV